MENHHSQYREILGCSISLPQLGACNCSDPTDLYVFQRVNRKQVGVWERRSWPGEPGESSVNSGSLIKSD